MNLQLKSSIDFWIKHPFNHFLIFYFIVNWREKYRTFTFNIIFFNFSYSPFKIKFITNYKFYFIIIRNILRFFFFFTVMKSSPKKIISMPSIDNIFCANDTFILLSFFKNSISRRIFTSRGQKVPRTPLFNGQDALSPKPFLWPPPSTQRPFPPLKKL